MTALFPQDAPRPSADPSWIAPAKVELLTGTTVHPRWQVSVRLSADQEGPFTPGNVSFLSGETLERAPLRAVSVQLFQKKDRPAVLVIDVERVGRGHFVVPPAILVVLRGAPPPDEAVAPPPPVVSGVNYLARDFDSFRKLMLDWMTSITPAWTDTTPADLGVMLVEVLAYLADDLAYWQDAIATEAYLQTARREMSIRRHTRLLGYWLDQGMGARAWIQLSATSVVTVPRGTELLAGLPGQPLVAAGSTRYQQCSALATAVFETLMDLTVDPSLDQITLWDEDRSYFVISAGATSAVIVSQDGESLPQTGDVLLFESTRPGTSDDYSPHPVRLTNVGQRDADGHVELQWDQADAPQRDLPVTRRIDGVVQSGLSVLRGNVTLADFGQTRLSDLPVRKDGVLPYEPSLPYTLVSSAPPPAEGTPAASWTKPDKAEICAAIRLQEYCDPKFLSIVAPASAAAWSGDGDTTIPRRAWTPVPDLLLSGPYSRVFVVEPEEEDGSTSLRFGDGVFGLAPPVGSWFRATFRVGDMSLSNVGVGAITTIVATDASWSEAGLRVTNPIAATGGYAGETLMQARQMAPALVTDIEAAITAPDYVAIATGVSGVADAAAVLRWTGSWFTMFVYVRVTGSCSAAVLSQVEDALAIARVAGRAIVVREPVWIAIDLRLRITLSSGFLPEQVRASLRDAFVAPASGGSPAGFFDPSRWTFGETVFASAIVTWAKGVRGVADAEVIELARAPGSPGDAAPANSLVMAADELPWLEDEPLEPQNGTLRIDVSNSDEVWA